MSYETIPADELAAVVTFLEMRKRPDIQVPTSDLSLRAIPDPDVDRYRQLFRLIGQDWLWFSRLIMTDAELAEIIGNPGIELFAIIDQLGTEVGILELDFREAGECELAFVGMIPFAAILYAAGVPIERGNEQALMQSPIALTLTLLYLLILMFFGIRMILASPVASEEHSGPVQIIRRSWQLTAGHWWRLFGFIVLFVIAALVLMTAVNFGVSTIAVMLFGQIDPMSLSALFIGLFDSIVSGAITVFLAVMLARIYLQVAGRDGVSVPKSGI